VLFVSAEDIALLRAVLRSQCSSDRSARDHLAAAAAHGVDPLDYCAHRFGLGTEIVWLRAAEWAGFTFATRTPRAQRHETALRDIPDMADVRTLRQEALGEDIVFYAPRFANVVALARHRRQRPAIARHLRFVPPEAPERGWTTTLAPQLIDRARQDITRRWPRASAAVDLPLHVRIAFALVLLGLVALVGTGGLAARPLFVPIAGLLLIGPGLMRFAAALPRPGPHTPLRLLADGELPLYSVLIPLRDEAAMVPLLAKAMRALDYPPEKLDIRFVVEERSPETVRAVEALLDDPRFRLTRVADCTPRTKPKALDFALPLVRGEHVVVYDAEDVPEPDQLRQAATRFAADRALACLQAELVPENAGETWLTALFAGEYAGLFGRLLPALARWGLPVPLGGTSNHFRVAVLRGIGGWDAFNVTEDADLGVRLARRGMKVALLDSTTLEEAPVTMAAWIAQRTRWTKGWMQTFIVHNRAPLQFLRDVGWRPFLGFQILIGGMMLSAVLHTVFVATTLLRLPFAGFASLVPHDVWDWLTIAILVIGYGGAVTIVTSGLIHRGKAALIAWELLLPVYWILHTIAAVRAAWQLVAAPSYWAKTTHGVTRMARTGAAGDGSVSSD